MLVRGSVFLALVLAAPALAGGPPLISLPELTQPYQGVGEPGLYPGGSNTPSGGHLAYGQSKAAAVVPRDTAGNPAAAGWIGVVIVGMSNTNQEGARFEREADAHLRHGGRVVLVDAAQGGVDTFDMADPATREQAYWQLFDHRLQTAGVDPDQVQVVWFKNFYRFFDPIAPFPQEADRLRADLRTIVDVLRARCPQLHQVFFSSMASQAYAAGKEPFAYETGWSVKGLIQDQIDDVGGLGSGPWLGWGPYVWADGATPRADGFAWLASDFETDNVHPALTGEWKVANHLTDFFAADPLVTGWYGPEPGSRLEVRAAVADADVDPAAPNLNHGSGQSLNFHSAHRIYLKFDLAGLSSAQVERAKLSLQVDDVDAVTSGQVFTAQSNLWDEATLTFANAPPTAGAALMSFRGFSRGSAVGFDVTAAVDAALDSGASEISLVLVPAATAAAGLFDARESPDPPRLVVTSPGPPTVWPIFADGFESGDTWVWSP